MQKIFQDSLILRTCHCDFTGSWRLGSILEAMQEAAGAHSHILGCGRDALLEKGIAWVLSRSEVHMLKYPQVGDAVTIETFPMPNRRWFFPRYFIFRDGKGQPLGYAGTLWVLLDLNARKMLPPGEVALCIPDNSDLTPPMGLPGMAETLAGDTNIFSQLPRYTDLDVNGHVNNTRYADWALDALGIDMMKENCIQSLKINYAAEILPHQEMEMRMTLSHNSFHLSGHHEGKMHFEMSGALSKR